MIELINKHWSWLGFSEATEIIREYDFGNVIFRTFNKHFWRICPEEITGEKIAESEEELEKLLKTKDFIEDFEMTNFTQRAIRHLGNLKTGDKFCLKIAGQPGGEYKEDNIGTVSTTELISLSGDLAFVFKDALDDDEFEIIVE